MALAKPTRPVPRRHADRLTDAGVTPSLGRTGVCGDNAAIKTTWTTVKREVRHIHGDPDDPTGSQLRTIPFGYIETFHNRQRHQARPGHRTPSEAYTASTEPA